MVRIEENHTEVHLEKIHMAEIIETKEIDPIEDSQRIKEKETNSYSFLNKL